MTPDDFALTAVVVSVGAAALVGIALAAVWTGGRRGEQ